MRFVAGCNQRYLSRMQGYFDSVNKHSVIDKAFVAVKFPAPNIPGFPSVHISEQDNYGAPSETECIQHGSFVNVLDFPDDEIVIYTDGDFFMQRPMDSGEFDFFNLKKGEAITSWNGSEGETLSIEFDRLSPKVSRDDMTKAWGEGWEKLYIFNVGLIVMRFDDWREMYQIYMEHWGTACLCMGHAARQQWLISWVLNKYFQVKVAPWSIHAHGHFGLKPGMTVENGVAYHNGKVALFKHHL